MPPRPDTAPYREALGHAIRRRRVELGLSQEEVSFEAEVDRTYMTGLEGGSRNPTIETVLRIAEALATKPSELLAQAEASMGRRKR